MLGLSYWHTFMRSNSNLIVSKKGQKYKLDRSSWSTYRNFNQIYSRIGEEKIEAKFAEEHAVPVWMDKKGDKVYEQVTFRCKVTHDITRRDLYVVMEKVEGNIEQKGDGNIGGELQLCKAGKSPTKK